MEVLRDWVRKVPLTGEGASTGVGSTDRSGAMRIAFSQWDTGVRVAECPTCACSPAAPSSGSGIPTLSKQSPTSGAADRCGRLTGKLSELEADLTWHEGVKRRCKTWVKEAEEFAGEVFKESPQHRKKVLLLYTDGRIMDKDQLGPAGAVLAAEGVKVFGIVLKRAVTATAQDWDNLAALKEVVSDPKDTHALMMTVDESHTVLDDFCDPNSVFGAYIAAAAGGGSGGTTPTTTPLTPCAPIGAEPACTALRHCEWDSMTLECREHPCAVHCAESDCLKDPNHKCQWNAAADLCEKTICSDHGTQDKCKDAGCAWDATKDPKCVDEKCPAKTADACNQLGKECKWDTTANPAKCVEAPCYQTTPDKAACQANPLCEWDDACPEGRGPDVRGEAVQPGAARDAGRVRGGRPVPVVADCDVREGAVRAVPGREVLRPRVELPLGPEPAGVHGEVLPADVPDGGAEGGLRPGQRVHVGRRGAEVRGEGLQEAGRLQLPEGGGVLPEGPRELRGGAVRRVPGDGRGADPGRVGVDAGEVRGPPARVLRAGG
eukprot:Sspe_Gene.28038::Locus_12480_Transcript_1_1_Confidence_1.000_Length_1641::g.28038::m.28038